MPDISDIEPKLISNFLVRSLAGFLPSEPKDLHRPLSVLVRLVDKAKYEYLTTREAVLAEEAEIKMSYEDIIKRGEGQFMYTSTITNHLENCINTLSRIYKILPLLLGEFSTPQQKGVVDVRNAIEHLDERISRGVEGPLSINISDDALVAEVAGETVRLEDIANEIRTLHQKVFKFMNP